MSRHARSRPESAPRAVRSPEPSDGRSAAIFDVDGTLTRSDIFRDLVAFRRAVGSGRRHAAWMAGLPLRAVGLLLLDQVSREAVNRWTYTWYAGFAREDFARWAEEFQRGPGLARLHPRAEDLVVRHAAAGHRLVFVSGAVDLLVQPLARLVEQRVEERLGERHDIRVEAMPLAVEDGRFTGALGAPALGGREKARRVARVAAEEGLDLARSWSYGDSIADLPLLLSVGHPAAANPDLRLRREARRRGWPVLDLARTRTP